MMIPSWYYQHAHLLPPYLLTFDDERFRRSFGYLAGIELKLVSIEVIKKDIVTWPEEKSGVEHEKVTFGSIADNPAFF